MGACEDVIILTTAKDFLRVRCNYPRLIQNMMPRKVIFIGNTEVGELAEKLRQELHWDERQVGFLNEDEIIPFDAVHKKMMKCLGVTELGRGVTGWYYQQFLKMQYSALCKNDYYLVWDGDTVPCKPFSMFAADGITPYLDLKREYHEEYFKTLERLLPGMHKVIRQSFIAEHMLMKKEIMQSLIAEIMKNPSLQGDYFWERILGSIPAEKLLSNSFSEFETYGTYAAIKYTDVYRLRNWHSFRYAGEFFRPQEMTDEDYEWLGADFDAVSFEKNHFVRPDHDNLFNNRRYQQALSARKMLEIAQEEFKEGYLETWEEFDNSGTAEEIPEYKVYEQLAEQYLGKNHNQAFLCYENAEFLCQEENVKSVLRGKKEALLQSGSVNVKKVSIVIVSYNSKYLMEKCVESIRKTCPPQAYGLLVVDNASTDGVREYLQQQNDMKLILSEHNLGFPVGCNVGVRYSEPGTDVFLLNNDTRLAKNSLFWLRMGLYEKTDVGAVGAVANYCGNEQQVDVEFSLPGDYVEYGETVNVPCERPYEERNRLCGYAMLIRREAWDKAGGMDENLSPGYFDDDDLSTRIREQGYHLYICHNSFLYHAGSQSFCKRDDLDHIVAKNYYYLLDKWKFDIPTFSLANMKAIKQIKAEKNAHIRVLEIGAGMGSTLSRIRYLYPNAEVTGVEKNALAVRYAIDSVEIICGNWEEELPLEEDYFDIILYTKRGDKEVDKLKFIERVGKYLRRDVEAESAVAGDFENVGKR